MAGVELGFAGVGAFFKHQRGVRVARLVRDNCLVLGFAAGEPLPGVGRLARSSFVRLDLVRPAEAGSDFGCVPFVLVAHYE